MDGVEASYVDLADPTRLEFEHMRRLASLVDARWTAAHPLSALQVGGGACAFARQLTAVRPASRITVVERDGGLIDIARRHLGLVTTDRLRVVVADGRGELRRRPDAGLDLVVIDAFVGRAVPMHLVSGEFLDEVRRVMRPGGVHAVNLIDGPPTDFAAAVVATLLSRFQQVPLMAHPQVMARRTPGNFLTLASDSPLPVAVLDRSARRDRVPWETRSGRALRTFTRGAPVLSDERRDG
jgi:spermidine synthase